MPGKKSDRGGKFGMSQDTGSDATPADDGIDINKIVNQSKKHLKALFDFYTAPFQKSFNSSSPAQQQVYIDRSKQIVCICIAVVILQSFYPFLLKEVRIMALPLLVGVAWLIASRWK